MKKLTARNSTFLHNAKLMFGAPAYKRILAAAQHSEGQAWNVAREYISLDGSEATRKVMFSERYADLDTMFRAIKAEFSAEPAAIAANVSADAAPAWTPAVGDRVTAVIHAVSEEVTGVVIYEKIEGGARCVCIEDDDGFKRWMTVNGTTLTPAPDAAQAEAAALAEQVRETEDLLMQNGHHTPTVRLADQVNGVYRSLSAEADRSADVIDDLQQYRGWINDLIEGIDHVSPIEALTRLLAFRRTYETDRARFADDAALASARQRADDGTRHSVADVEAALEAQWAEAWTPKVGDRVRVVGKSRFSGKEGSVTHTLMGDDTMDSMYVVAVEGDKRWFYARELVEAQS